MSTDPVLDLAAYSENTQALVDSMDETTALFNDMADNMAQLSSCFEGFGEADRTVGHSGGTTTAGQAAD